MRVSSGKSDHIFLFPDFRSPSGSLRPSASPILVMPCWFSFVALNLVSRANTRPKSLDSRITWLRVRRAIRVVAADSERASERDRKNTGSQRECFFDIAFLHDNSRYECRR